MFPPVTILILSALLPVNLEQAVVGGHKAWSRFLTEDVSVDVLTAPVFPHLLRGKTMFKKILIVAEYFYSLEHVWRGNLKNILALDMKNIFINAFQGFCPKPVLLSERTEKNTGILHLKTVSFNIRSMYSALGEMLHVSSHNPGILDINLHETVVIFLSLPLHHCHSLHLISPLFFFMQSRFSILFPESLPVCVLSKSLCLSSVTADKIQRCREGRGSKDWTAQEKDCGRLP